MRVRVEQNEGFEWGRWFRAVCAGALVMIVGGALTAVASAGIQSLYPDRPRPSDLLFDLLPYVSWTQFAVELVYFASLGLLCAYLVSRHHLRQVPEIAALYGIIDIIRALLTILTPLAAPYAEATHFNYSGGLIRLWGEFPSGHVATMVLFYLVVDRKEAPGFKRTLLALLVAEIVLLLTSHSHYSISVVGGLLLGYFVYHEYYRGTLFNWLKPFVRV